MPAYFKKAGRKGRKGSHGSYHANNPPGTKEVLHKGKKKRGKPGIGKPYMSGKAS